LNPDLRMDRGDYTCIWQAEGSLAVIASE